MELRAGYKRTETEAIPREWAVKRLGDIASLCKERVDPQADGTSGFCVELEHVEPGTGQLMGNTSVDSQASTKAVFRTGDVLFGKLRAYLRKYWLADREGVCSTEFWVLAANRQMVIPEFLFYLVTTEEFINMASMAYGTHMPRSDWNLAKNYRLALPGLEEQRAIASALSDVDALISSLDKLIAKKRDIKQAAMQQLLTGRRRLPGFSGRWEERRLEDVAALDSENLGGDTPRDYEFNYVSLEDVNRGILRGYANQLFSSAPSRARRVIRSGDVLVSTVRPNLGSHLLFKSSSPDWICSTGFSVVRCVEDAACPGYVFYHLFGDYVTRQIDAQLTGSSYPAISSKDVGNLRMPFPSIDEQRAIASVLSDMDAEIEALERRRDKTWLLKQGMMQELLTGRVRLV